jgi:predicted cupin superfamily sugar epimerase
MDPAAQAVIDALGLQPHPEGGWFRETWRAPGPGRSPGTCIHFLLEAGAQSRWHRVDAAELWLHQGGGPLDLSTADGDGVRTRRLGADLWAGERLQLLVEPHQWQGAKALGRFALAACVVVPGFEFQSFELAPECWSPGTPGS